MTPTHDRGASWSTADMLLIVAGIAAIIGSLAIFAGPRRTQASQPTPGTTFARWESVRTGGRVLGVEGAPVAAVVFSDYQCPACKRLHHLIDTVLSGRSDFEVRMRHLPLPQLHTEAIPAAVAAECAAMQGRFVSMNRELFEDQSGVADREWDALAKRAGVPDRAAFKRCLNGSAAHARVDEDRALAANLGLAATPTFIVDGIKYSHSFTAQELRDTLVMILSRKGAAPRQQ